ncbi:vacuolar protein sorting-associated protein 26-domain-containing protein [Lactarius hatsudake]|nr:vacuolar protein sorting-associated protein 26-domain-containing protein [Lactarius hatsudake]
MTSSLKARKQIYSKAEKVRPIRVPFITSRSLARAVLQLRSPPRIPLISQEVATPRDLRQAQTFEFMFKNVEKQYESYLGINVKLRYFIRVTISRRMADVVKERDIWVHSFRMPPDSNSSIKTEVGIEDYLYIGFGYNKSKYHLKDMISIIRRETTGSPPNQYNESEAITKFEIMDGAHPILFLLLRYRALTRATS